METGTVFIISYMIQIPIALYAIFAIPMRGELPTVYENMRKNGMILFGVLPCAFFSVLMQLISLAMYMAKVKSIEAKANKAQARFNASLGWGSQRRARQPVRRERTACPTSSCRRESTRIRRRSVPPPQPDQNPFGDDSGGPSTPPSDNPFA